LGGTDEVEAAVDQAPETVVVAEAEEAHALHLGGIVGIDALQGREIEAHAVAVDERSDEASFVKEVQRLRRRIDVARVARVQVVGREDFAHQDRGVEGEQDRAGDDRDTVPAELPPHDLPLRGAIEALLRGRQLLRRVRLEGLGGDVVFYFYFAVPPVRRMRGSSAASSRSEMNMPITVSSERNIRNDPARYWSWLRNASSSIGPEVCSESTTATIAEPEITLGSRLPMSAMNGLSAMRSGYFTSRRKGGMPLARAVTTYCFCSSSSRLARRRRIMPAVPEVPMTITGIQRCSSTERNLPQLQGWPRYSGSMMPPTERPNSTLAKYISTSASRKLGVARPM